MKIIREEEEEIRARSRLICRLGNFFLRPAWFIVREEESARCSKGKGERKREEASGRLRALVSDVDNDKET